MGSSTGQPRSGHERPKHLPKVGTPENLAWEYRTRLREVFGSRGMRIAVALLAVFALLGIGLVFL